MTPCPKVAGTFDTWIIAPAKHYQQQRTLTNVFLRFTNQN